MCPYKFEQWRLLLDSWLFMKLSTAGFYHIGLIYI
jgi:hypothetical protein